MTYDANDYDPAEGPQAGPSWQRDNWPLGDGGDLTAALDPMQMQVAVKAAIRDAGKGGGQPVDEAAIARAADRSIRAMMLIRTYRVRGHLAADLDPLGLSQQDIPADLTPEYHGFTAAEMDEEVFLGGTMGFDKATVRHLIDTLRANYCGKVGLEYMHISDVEERRFFQDRMEGVDKGIEFTENGKKAILSKVIEAETFENFLGKKYVGTKRFGLDGGESMIPALEAVIKYGGQLGLKEIVYGMPHRGRLNVLANVMAKPY
ncbi:MAG: 2-oxoglutarate dehydrogenase E1 component, partial [Gammaproteobacteria bacterium]|nr:2-oxoglutarate dehydrogenase E1 component [Gammaproteobacteria bacterium]